MSRTIASAVFAATIAFAAAATAAPAGPTAVAAPQVPQSPSPATVPSAAHVLEKSDLDAWLDGFVPYALKSGDIAGAVVSVVKDGQVLSEKGYGYADVARKIPMDPARTMVRAGSTSKLFTWTAVMQLVEQHKLDLDRDVNAYLDFEIPHKNGKAITLRNLMNHTAGFEEGLKDILSTNPNGLESTEQYLKQHPRPLLFTPGTVPAYSNYGASVAGYIVQRISGEPYETYIERHILAPLGMAHTTFVQPLPAQFEWAMAKGYMTASSTPQAYELIVTRPAGSATTTADDMAHFMIAQLQLGRFGDQEILKPETARLMQSPSESALPGFSTMAHGFFYDTHYGRLVIGHGGDTIVFHTELDLLPRENVGIYYTFSSRGKESAVYGARAQLFDEFMKRYFPAPKAAALAVLPSAKEDAAKIAGIYESSRRVEHGFLSLFYLLQQTTIGANADGTIAGPAEPGLEGQATFREVGPDLWQEKDGTRRLALRTVDGVKTVIDSADPISVLQAVPLSRSSNLNLPILLASFAVLAWTLVLWPLTFLLRRGDAIDARVTPEVSRLRTFLRGAALVDVVYLAAWTMVLMPVLSTQLQVYNASLDPIVLTLEIAGVLAIAAAVTGLWVLWRMVRTDAPLLSKIWSALVTAALIGVVWIGFMGKLISINLNY